MTSYHLIYSLKTDKKMYFNFRIDGINGNGNKEDRYILNFHIFN